jgi:thermitase
VRQCKCNYRGVCCDGHAVFDVSAGQVNSMRAMSTEMDADVPPTEELSNRLLISYADKDNKPSADTLKAAGLTLVQDYERGSFLIVEPQAAVSAATVDTLMKDEAVMYAAPDYIMSVQPVEQTAMAEPPAIAGTEPNDPMFNQLWGMKNCGATQVWTGFRETPKIIVAVIDSGVDYNHPDLKANMWSKNGKHGYDFYDDDSDPMDEQNHGTHVAGTIAGVGNNGVGVVGVSWNAQIMALRFLGPDGSGATSDGVKCIDWAVANGAMILCNSWAGPDTSPELAEAVARAEKRGVLFVAAAGNTGGTGNDNDRSPFFPASLTSSNVISVGAIDSNDARGSFSHYGQKSVDIGAPGVGIVSTTRNNQYDKYSGTSMAAPHVAGAAVLVWGKTFPNPTQDRTQMAKVRDLIYENARPVPALKSSWGYTAPAKVPGGVLDLTFLSREPSNGIPTPPQRQRFVENRMKVKPSQLR